MINPKFCLRWRIAVFSIALLFVVFGSSASGQKSSHPVLVIVLDGLRRDYVTPELMPNLHRLGESGAVGEKHHSVFPTVTRVNAASIATGCYPAVHGLVHNKFYLPKVSPDTLNAAEAED